MKIATSPANSQQCVCGHLRSRHIGFGCKDCTCIAYRPTGTPNEAWVLLGHELLHGETGNPERDSPLVSFETDDGEWLTVSAAAIARSPEQVRQQIRSAMARLSQLAAQFDQETKGEMA